MNMAAIRTATTPATRADFQKVVDRVAAALDADVLLVSGPLEFMLANHVIDKCVNRSRRPNVALVLCTFGGDADVAYRIARCLQRLYKKISLIVDGFCKSAGTLVALSSDELVLSDFADLGPLDVQMAKDDEFGARRSGLTAIQAFDSLAYHAFTTFQSTCKRLANDTELEIPPRLAVQIASEMTVGMIRQIYRQIDPLSLGEFERATSVAEAYGKRLALGRDNVRGEAMIGRLIAGYPSHSFAIDREEAKDIFSHVREPNAAEGEMLALVNRLTRVPVWNREQGTYGFLSTEKANAGTAAVRSARGATRVNARGDRKVARGERKKNSGVKRAAPPRTQSARASMANGRAH